MSIENAHTGVFKSKRDTWATVIVWGIALLLWLFSWSIIASEGPVTDRLIGASVTFLLGLTGPWFWFTTRYRITSTSLHLQSGAFHKELKFREISLVTGKVPVRGLSFAFSRDALHIEVKDSPRGYQISPVDRSQFMAELQRHCPHLKLLGGELVEASDDRADL